MSSNLLLQGSLQAGADSCAGSCGTNPRTTVPLGLLCSGGQPYQSIANTDSPIFVQTQGVAGQAFIDLAMLEQFVAIEFLYLRADQPMIVRIGADVARVTGVGGVFPTGFGGGQTFNPTIDGVAFAVVFQAGDQTAAQCAARINAAAALAGLATPVATVATSGQLVVAGALTGAQGSIIIAAGTGNAVLGFVTGTTHGTGADVPLYGTMILEFPRQGFTPAPPARIQISGTGNVSLLVGGRTTP